MSKTTLLHLFLTWGVVRGQYPGWTTGVADLCGALWDGIDTANITGVPWRGNGCSDDPMLALCFVAKGLAGPTTCQAMLNEKNGICNVFPDALSNHCCQSYTAECPGGGAEDADTAIKAYLPDHSAKKKESDVVDPSAEPSEEIYSTTSSTTTKLVSQFVKPILVVGPQGRVAPTDEDSLTLQTDEGAESPGDSETATTNYLSEERPKTSSSTTEDSGSQERRRLQSWGNVRGSLDFTDESILDDLWTGEGGSLDVDKNLLIFFSDKLDQCSAISSLWRVTRLAAVLLDVEAFEGMSVPNATAPPMSSGKELLRGIGTERLKIPLNEAAKNVNSDKRFIDQWGASEPFSESDLRSESGDSRRLQGQSCHSLSELLVEAGELSSDYFSGIGSETSQFGQMVGELIDKYFYFINSTSSEIKGQRSLFTSSGLATPSFVMVPACLPAELQIIEQLRGLSTAFQPLALLQATQGIFSDLASSVANLCDGEEEEKCILTEIWSKVIETVDDSIATQSSTASSEVSLMGAGLKAFADEIGLYIATKRAPRTAGEVYAYLIAAARTAAVKKGLSSATVAEMALLFLEALQIEVNLDTIFTAKSVHSLVQKFIQSDLGCGQNMSRRKLADEEEVSAALDEEVADEQADSVPADDRQLQRHGPSGGRYRNSGNLLGGMEIVGRMEINQSERLAQESDEVSVPATSTTTTTTTTSTTTTKTTTSTTTTKTTTSSLDPSLLVTDPEESEDVVAAHQSLAPAMAGYQCRDDIDGFFVNYLDLWMARADCSDIISTFGCLPEATVLPLAVLVNSCPQAWAQSCWNEIKSSDSAALLLLSGESLHSQLTQLKSARLEGGDLIPFSPVLECIVSQHGHAPPAAQESPAVINDFIGGGPQHADDLPSREVQEAAVTISTTVTPYTTVTKGKRLASTALPLTTRSAAILFAMLAAVRLT